MITQLTKETAIAFFAHLYRGEHHLPSEMRDDGRGVFSVSEWPGDAGFSSYDYDGLTRLVLLAHERCVRAWITSGGPGRIRIWISARDRESNDMSLGHPTIDQAVVKFRTADDVSWWKFTEATPEDATDDKARGRGLPVVMGTPPG